MCSSVDLSVMFVLRGAFFSQCQACSPNTMLRFSSFPLVRVMWDRLFYALAGKNARGFTYCILWKRQPVRCCFGAAGGFELNVE